MSPFVVDWGYYGHVWLQVNVIALTSHKTESLADDVVMLGNPWR